MKKRCKDSNHHAYKYYGGRGIKVCDEWLDEENGFKNFYNWAINNGYIPDTPRGKYTLDRINNNGNYEPNNCRWVDMKIQSTNRRKPDNKLGKNPNAKRIVKLDLDGNYICEYDCIKSALIDNNINLQSSCINACCKGNQKTAYGYKWMYNAEWILIHDKFKDKFELSEEEKWQ